MYYIKTQKKLKLISILALLALISSCQRPDNGFAPSVSNTTAIDASEIYSNENVISGSYELSGTTAEIAEKKVSGSVTIEGVFNE
ncbi:MAG: hypothetical protein H7Z71_07950 [Moraxellaceae bacterium]|nr:hypothetical protein [Pseudobdellovibrionaceae bacterium]